MNVYHLNSGVEPRVLHNADADIWRYTDFISKSIEFLKKETVPIKVTKSQHVEETRYTPKPPINKNEEKAIDLLFQENTKSIFDQRTNFNREAAIEIIDQNEDEYYITLSREIQGETIYLKPDIYQLDQQKRALDNLRGRPLKEHRPLLELFGYPDSSFWNQSYYPKEFDWKILTDNTKEGINEQRDFVSKAMQTKDFAFMEGPPGSGKTTTIIELILQLTAEGKRVLLCSATHAAIDNVIERIKGRFKNVCDQEIVPVRVSRFEKPVKENVRPYLLNNLVKTYKNEIERHLKDNQELNSQRYLLKNLYSKADYELNYYTEPLIKFFQGNQDEQKRIKRIKNKYDLLAYLSNKVQPQNNDEEFYSIGKEILQELISDIDPIEKIILDSANLVAGTMVGILQHPDIRNNRQGASFDVLIVDEASKVTFSDFIVPALHAKKWILVGDVKQLSPYVENDYISENIASILDVDVQKLIVQQFEFKTKLEDSRYEDCLKVYFTSSQNPDADIQLVDNLDLIVEVVNEDWSENEINIIRINSADVVIAKNTSQIKHLIFNNIHVKSIFFNADVSSLNQRHRQDYFRKAYKTVPQYAFNNQHEEWSDIVASKLNQSFSFRNASGFENIENELKYLIPKGCIVKKEIKTTNGFRIEEVGLGDEINDIKRLVFPSILEMLQNGAGKIVYIDRKSGQRFEKNNSILTKGFFEGYKKSRFVSLTYQYRMHPDIARTSKENFYGDKNLLPARYLYERAWDDLGKVFRPNEPFVKWVSNNYNYKKSYQKLKYDLERWFSKKNDINQRFYKNALNNFLSWAEGKIFNPIEIDDIENELLNFLEWAKNNPRMIRNPLNGSFENRNYEVAVLTFYLHQESELKKSLRRITKQKNHHSRFQMPNTDIFLYTVDKFQGQEADLVLLGFTKYYGDAHFNSPNRLNVALTRARHKLVLFGNKPFFREKAKLKALRDLATNYESILRYEK